MQLQKGVAQEEEKKAKEELKKERRCSHALANDVDRLKKILQEREGAITMLGKVIEDLRVKKTEMAHSFKKVEKANTDLIGKNTSLHECIHGECLSLVLSLRRICSLRLTFVMAFRARGQVAQHPDYLQDSLEGP